MQGESGSWIIPLVIGILIAVLPVVGRQEYVNG
jgi:hypothetical protein